MKAQVQLFTTTTGIESGPDAFDKWSLVTIFKTFQQFGKQYSLRHILKGSANMYESSGSQFLKSTNGIDSSPDTFDESRLNMTFLTKLGL